VTAAPEHATEAPPRFLKGEPVTIVVTATADAEYEACAQGGTTVPMLEARLPSKNAARMSVPCDAFPGVRVIHGDIMPTLLHMAADAIAQHKDCTEDECMAWVDLYEKALDALGATET
jgi:hypothetical protein